MGPRADVGLAWVLSGGAPHPAGSGTRPCAKSPLGHHVRGHACAVLTSASTSPLCRLAWDLGVKPVIARRGTEHGSGLGTQRWVVERAFAHLHWFRRLRIRWEIRDDIHEAFLTLGCALICWRRLNSFR